MSVRTIPDFLKRDPLELGYPVSKRRMMRTFMGMPDEEWPELPTMRRGEEEG
ncbi:hypothetical protein [Croceicoccus sediminis]|uniref:hypothetical protein n=1 Tax=Croceicoccus sediminis TaxID=2571150 RepID=UPI0014794EF4|nr:hypothetical protein [Croceicoccus sediminis]